MKTTALRHPRHLLALASAVLVLSLPPAVSGQSCGDSADRGVSCEEDASERWEQEWQEKQVELPGMPDDDNLMPIDATRGDARYEYLVDKTSIVNGGDGVMRYTVVISSGSGARNVFHEGIRCETDEVKTYAYATAGGDLSRAHNPRWRPVAIHGVRAYQEFLAAVIVCDRNGFAWDAEKAVAALEGQYTSGGVRIRTSRCRDCMDAADNRRND